MMERQYGTRPVFMTSSARIVEEFLTFADLEVTAGNGRPHLWNCASDGCVSKKVATDGRLLGQYGQRWNGTLPLERGERAA